jgi:uncharacterized protein (UPF0335 family)
MLAPQEQKQSVIGDNGFELTEAEKRALLVNGLNQIEGLVERKDEIVSDIRTARKRLVAHGFKPKVIDFALRLRKEEDGEMIEQRRAEMEVARFLNHPIGTQPELPLDMVDRTPGVDKAKAEGEIAGAEGQTCHSPHVAGTPIDQAWIEGWHVGQTTIASAFQKLEAKEAAEPDEDEEGDED